MNLTNKTRFNILRLALLCGLVLCCAALVDSAVELLFLLGAFACAMGWGVVVRVERS